MTNKIGLFLAALALPTQGHADGLDSFAAKKTELEISSSECPQKSEGIFCINGVISPRTVEEIKSVKRLTRVIVNSEGGDADSAMKIGRKIFSDGAILEVQSKCISACANYMVPAARHLEVNENSFVIIHGAVSRGVAEYNSLVRKNEKYKPSIFSTSVEFSKVREGILKRENAYFDHILKDDAYVTRYREQIRNLLLLKKVKCENYNEFFLILDKKYFSEFGIQLKKWPSKSDRELFDAARFSFSRANIIYGIESEFIRILNPIGTNCIYSFSGNTEKNNDSSVYDEREIF